MSLSRDALRRAFVAPESYAPVVTSKPKPKVTAPSMRGLHCARVLGCHRRTGCWQVSASDGKAMYNLGSFPDYLRARVAWKLWMYWFTRGYPAAEIPRKPDRRPYMRTYA